MATALNTGDTGGYGPFGTAQGGSQGPAGGQSFVISATGGATANRCGNGYLNPGEECDDGNLSSGDGCSSVCKLEIVDPCLSHGCRVTVVCGDAVRASTEACDDGNTTGGDGCASDCTVEPGSYCPIPGQRCVPIHPHSPNCGNGTLESDLGESCDEGSLNGLSGHCPEDCGPIAVCGNAIIEAWAGETCDEGVNDASYGGCTSDCQQGPHCGDGVRNGPEACDLGDQNDAVGAATFGGCLSNCELGPYCGDGIVQSPYERCDDGPKNGTVASICSIACLIYPIAT